ncbi:hypothetical protein GCM10027429_20390 [Marivirga atlantica]|jgi:hypothetical protein|uniref:Translation initiation factor IF-2 n=1 Tax=Marivirga atlantica TaxID=1548457 RepID=A0A937ALB6_9BACT|nr:hypothetical protein [Marivirga atlantica]MBL0765658.1 hypothetical protein [Marivirga atlantica]
MRLAQAARKLTITTDEIVSFFKKREIEIIKDSNTKLEEDHIELLFNYYGVPIKEEKTITSEPEIDTVKEDQIVAAEAKLEDEVADKVEDEPNEVADQTEAKPETSDEMPSSDIVEETNSHKAEEEEQENIKELTTPQHIEEVKPSSKYKTVTDLLEEQEAKESSDELDEDNEEEEVVIKAPKVTLQGLNVVGKIDLPEPKPKEAKEEKAEETSEKKQSRSNSRKPYKKHQKKGRRKELSPQQIREKEKKKAEQKRIAEEKARKKQREAYYKENVLKPQQQLQKKKKPKKKQQTTTLAYEGKTETKPTPKTALGKFWRWLNT